MTKTDNPDILRFKFDIVRSERGANIRAQDPSLHIDFQLEPLSSARVVEKLDIYLREELDFLGLTPLRLLVRTPTLEDTHIRAVCHVRPL